MTPTARETNEPTPETINRQFLFILLYILSFCIFILVIIDNAQNSSPDPRLFPHPTTPRGYYDPTPFTPTYTCRTPTFFRPSPARDDVRLAALLLKHHASKGDTCVQDNKRFASWPWACVHLYTFGTASIGMCGPPGASLGCEQVADMVLGIEEACVEEEERLFATSVNEAGGMAVWGAGGSMVFVQRSG
ncbi:hypothetical protein P167DRAFT_545864 [Morchella conica CCBAS932]|uniref:Uncharacterized protein n=1 Tax=Morchella conica CCBAS932 TaxID=1392247 RepID=A0A3N4KNG5_9PEZI|nr:hypothetical protein P167DRAFT_545864 [Morchella conica CCBAS932]